MSVTGPPNDPFLMAIPKKPRTEITTEEHLVNLGHIETWHNEHTHNAAGGGGCDCWFAYYTVTGNAAADTLSSNPLPAPLVSSGTRPTGVHPLSIAAGTIWSDVNPPFVDGVRQTVFNGGLPLGGMTVAANPFLRGVVGHGTNYMQPYVALANTPYTVDVYQDNTGVVALDFQVSWTELSGCCNALTLPT